MSESASQTSFRVRYVETDQMGFAYYGNYAAWFEVGRVEFLRERGLAYRDVEAGGRLLAVRELSVQYLSPARYDDLITVRTRVAECGKSRVTFENEILREGRVLATGRVVLACLDRSGRPTRLGAELEKACAAS
ncbi:MAG TPA: thioesterase family protein [Planctomycetota bacterium]|nr:thioesterase family protein [Planctomycetota bacterium]